MPDELAARYGPCAVVIGAAQGIGRAFSCQLAAAGLDLVLVDVDPGSLQATARTIRTEYDVDVLTVVGDVTDAAVLDQLAVLDDVGMLVFNAALSVRGAWLDVPLERHLAAVELNVATLLRVLHLLLPAMVERGRGGVVLLSSMSALQGAPTLATYAASKAFVLSLAESLWDELRPAGVDVLALVPGATDTPGYRASAPAGRTWPPPQEPAEVAAVALDALGRRPSVVPGRVNRIAALTFGRVLPRASATRKMGRILRATYPEAAEPGRR